MSVTIQTALYDAMESSILQVECGLTRGFNGLQLIGTSSEVCKSGLERARAALEALGIFIPQKRIILNISPAHIRKDGSHFDLPFAVGLAALITEKEPKIDLSKWLFAAELGLDGCLRPVKGVISFGLASLSENLEGIVVAEENLEEISVLNRLRVHQGRSLKAMAFSTLGAALTWIFTGDEREALIKRETSIDEKAVSDPNFDDMVLDANLQKVSLVVATGLHSVLLTGAPGTGKSMFSARLTSIFPSIERMEHLESLRIHSSVMEKMPESLLSGRPPFRGPHHQSSASAIMGVPEQPGEISLAHGGVLFLDEFPEFRRDIVEALREPLETGYVRVSRAKKKVTWQSKITLIAACNACPCGWLGSALRRCSCQSTKILAYKRRLSGPILDRIDLHVRMPDHPGSRSDIFMRLNERKSESLTQVLSERVRRAREFSAQRNQNLGVHFNRDLKADQMVDVSGLTKVQFSNLVDSCTPKYATRRAIIRSLRVARTLADLDLRTSIDVSDLSQAWLWLPDTSDTMKEHCAYGV